MTIHVFQNGLVKLFDISRDMGRLLAILDKFVMFHPLLNQPKVTTHLLDGIPLLAVRRQTLSHQVLTT
jgi:hypothetical protein